MELLLYCLSLYILLGVVTMGADILFRKFDHDTLTVGLKWPIVWYIIITLPREGEDK